MTCNEAEKRLMEHETSQVLTDHVLSCNACQNLYTLLEHNSTEISLLFDVDLEITSAFIKANIIKRRNNIISLIVFMSMMILVFSIVVFKSDALVVFLKLQGLITLVMPVTLLIISLLKRKAVY